MRTSSVRKSVDFKYNQMQLSCRNHFHDTVRWCAGEIGVFGGKSAHHDFEHFFGRKPWDIRTFSVGNPVDLQSNRMQWSCRHHFHDTVGWCAEKSAFSCENQRNMTSKIFSVEKPVI